MSKLPQVNVRLAPEHHGLIRKLAQRLRTDPSLAVGLAEFLAQASESDPIQVSPLSHGLADEVAEMKERLEENRDLTLALQERLVIQSEGLRRTTAFAENINDRLNALEQQVADLRQKPASASLDAVELVEAPDMPSTPEALPDPPQKVQTRKRWREADDDVLRRIAAEGGTQADAVHELRRPSSVVNGKWKALGLPVEPRKGRKLKPRPKSP